MDRLRSLRTFICVAEQASFAEAGRRLNISPTAVTRAVAGLEASVGTPLLMRTTRSVRLTDEGAIFLDRCRAAIAELDGAFETVRGGGPTPRGKLTVTAPVMFGRLRILPIIAELLRLHPELEIRLLLLDRVVRLVEEGIDIAVRITEPADSTLRMVRVGEVQRVLAASPAYLDARGEPRAAADLGEHDLIGIEDEAGPLRGWRAGGRRRPPRFSVNGVETAIAAATAGLGIVQALSYQVADQFASGTLRRVLVDESTPLLPVQLLFQNGHGVRPNVRAFIEAARRHIGGHGG